MNKIEFCRESWNKHIASDDIDDPRPTNNYQCGYGNGLDDAFTIFSLTKRYHSDILIYAFRYALVRRSYSISIMQDAIKDMWLELTDHDRKLIKREIIEHKEKVKFIKNDYGDAGWTRLLELED